MLRHSHYAFALLALLLIFNGCAKDPAIPPDSQRDYIFLGHIYEDNDEVDKRIAAMDLSIYDQIWLGGDVCSESTQKLTTIQHINDVFRLGRKTTHWSLGNHDVRNGNISWITDATGRDTYYATHFEGITLLVLNTSLSEGSVFDTSDVTAQYQLIQNVCDTVAASSYLIVLSHHVVWDEIDLTTKSSDYANSDLSDFKFSLNPVLKYDEGVYPLLQQVQQKGVQVIHIAGDLGQRAAFYEVLTADGIQLIGSGITSNTTYNEQFPTAGQPDKFLVLHHDVIKQTIDWTYEELN